MALFGEVDELVDDDQDRPSPIAHGDPTAVVAKIWLQHHLSGLDVGR